MDSILSGIQSFVGVKYNDDDILRIGVPGAVEKFYEKLASTYNMTELQDILDCEDNMLIVACAGAGKTTTLLLKIIRDVLAGKLTKTVDINGIKVVKLKKILVSTFLKTGAEDLAKKFDELCNNYKIEGLSSKDIAFKTIHSEVYAALKSMGVTINIAKDEDLKKFLAESCKYFNIHSFMGNNKTITKEELSDIESIISYYRNRLDNGKYNHPLLKEYNFSEITLKAVIERFNKLKELNRVQDFEDLEELLYDGYSKFPRVVQTVSERYDYIYVDEFQDTSQLQYAILEPYFKSAEGILAIGDDDQCLRKDVEITTKNGVKKIQDIKSGDMVLTATGCGEMQYKPVDNVSKKKVSADIVVVKTKSGKELKGTEDHIIFTKSFKDLKEDEILNYIMFGGIEQGKNGVYSSELYINTINEDYVDIIKPYLKLSKKELNNKKYWSFISSTVNIDDIHKNLKYISNRISNLNSSLTIKKMIKLTENEVFDFTPLGNVIKGMIVPIVDSGNIIEDEIVDVYKEHYEDYVYDMSIPETRNFVANGIIVKNCIYSWRGSDIKIITEKFSEDYKPTIKHLSVNRRCPQEILNAVIPSIENNSFRHPKQLKASKEEGKIDVVIDGGIKYLSESIKKDLEKSERVGIISRTNADLIIPAMVLLLDNYTSFSVSKSVNLNNRMTSQIIGAMDLITQRYNNNFEMYFKLFTSKANSYQATQLSDILATDPELSIYNIPLEDLRYSVPSLFYIIRTLRIEKEKDPVGAYLALLKIMQEDVFNGRTIYAQRARDFIYYMIHLIEEHEVLKGKTIEELHELFNVVIPKKLDERIIKRQKREVDGKVEYYVPEDNSYVRITTVHDAKGKEWDNVYIWNDVDGCFPNSVGNRELSDEEFEEERRVHYIAWTRPKKKLTVFTRSDAEPGFLNECDLSNANIIKKNEVQGVGVSALPLRLSLDSRIKNNVKNMGNKHKSFDWREHFKKYIKKYTSYDKICTTQGTNLDICITKLGGIDKVEEYLSDCQLGSYPESDLESAISDLIESKIDSLN